MSEAEKVTCGMASDMYPSISSILRGRDLARVRESDSRVRYEAEQEGAGSGSDDFLRGTGTGLETTPPWLPMVGVIGGVTMTG